LPDESSQDESLEEQEETGASFTLEAQHD